MNDYASLSREQLVDRLRTLEWTERALRQSEELNRSTLQALPAHIAVIGCDGRIIAVNRAWETFALANDAAGSAQVTVGANYIEIVKRAADQRDDHAIRAIDGIEAVMQGALPQFSMEYPCHGLHEQRWFLMTVVPLGPHAGGGLVITHLNITERRLAEAAMERQRNALVREVHHRIKNHLQGVSGMLRGMVASYPECAKPLGVAIAQVRAIAQVYGLQSDRDDARVRLRDLLRTSAENIIGSVPVVCHLPPAGSEAILAREEAVPLALVVNELLTNAVKHIEVSIPQRAVNVALDIKEYCAVVRIGNRPAQLPSEFDFSRQRGIGTGLELVRALMSPEGARLDLRQEGEEVVAELVLESPVVWEFRRST